jgi:hypothetical protein
VSLISFSVGGSASQTSTTGFHQPRAFLFTITHYFVFFSETFPHIVGPCGKLHMSVFLLSYHSVPELSAVRSSVHCHFSGLHPLHYTLRPPVNSKLKLKTQTQNSNSKLHQTKTTSLWSTPLTHSTIPRHSSTPHITTLGSHIRHFSEPLTLFRRLHQCLYVSFAPLNHRPSHATPHRTPPSSTAHHTHPSLIADRPNASHSTLHTTTPLQVQAY